MTTYTSLTGLLAAYDTYTATATEIAAWNTVNAYAATDKVVTSAGLFGADLTAFNADCTASGSSVCTPSDYKDFTGWAIGVNWAPDSTTPPTDGDKRGVAFNTLMQYVEVTFTAAASRLRSG